MVFFKARSILPSSLLSLSLYVYGTPTPLFELYLAETILPKTMEISEELLNQNHQIFMPFEQKKGQLSISPYQEFWVYPVHQAGNFLESMMQSMIDNFIQNRPEAREAVWQRNMTQTTVDQLTSAQPPLNVSQYPNIEWITEQTEQSILGTMPDEILQELEKVIAEKRSKDHQKTEKLKSWWRWLISSDLIYSFKLAIHKKKQSTEFISLILSSSFRDRTIINHFLNTLSQFRLPLDVSALLVTDYIIGITEGELHYLDSEIQPVPFYEVPRLVVLFLLTYDEELLNNLVAMSHLSFSIEDFQERRAARRRDFAFLFSAFDQLFRRILPTSTGLENQAQNLSNIIVHILLQESTLLSTFNRYEVLSPITINHGDALTVLTNINTWLGQNNNAENANVAAHVLVLALSEPRIIRMLSRILRQPETDRKALFQWVFDNFNAINQQNFEVWQYPLLEAALYVDGRPDITIGSEEVPEFIQRWLTNSNLNVQPQSVMGMLAHLRPELIREIRESDRDASVTGLEKILERHWNDNNSEK
ncbi:MAG: hypothetical protein ACPG5T_04490 [Endozoicomonas sp.]